VAQLAAAGTKRLASGTDRLRRSPPGVCVLLYHRVGRRSSSQVDLPFWLFSEQLARLGPCVARLDDALVGLTGSHPGERPSVVVTFDDGTVDFVDEALPLLVERKIPATVYVATDFVERHRKWPDGAPAVTWPALADAITTGLVTVGSHTHTHALLDRLPPPAVEDELARSAGLIEDRLGVPALHFAYPKAVCGSPAAEVAVRRRFVSAALAGTRANRYGHTDPHRLARSPIQVGDGLRYFELKASGGMRLEDDLRRLVNRRRYAGAVN
jgi:peptidoglycan/xylan/chitin deacetylase (PgdA/CDA1 family)